jgi:hypothetical protein
MQSGAAMATSCHPFQIQERAMPQPAEGSKGFDLFKVLRERRDTLLDALAKVTLRVTSSRPYFAVSTALARPSLLAAGISRKATSAAAARILEAINMPSREDVLTLSQRLTRMEMVLDDVSAALDSAAAQARVRLDHPVSQRKAVRPSGDATKAG